MKYQRLFQILLLLAVLDSLVYGLWACFFPEGCFNLLDLPPRDPVKWKLLGVPLETTDHVLLWRFMGVFFLAHALILAPMAWRPRAWGSLALTLLLGRLLPLGAWLWLLGTDRVELRPTPLRVLAVHDGVWVIVLLVFWVAWRLAPQQASPK